MVNTLVLGVGNVLLADEGAGVHAMRYLQDHYDLPNTTYLDAGTLSFTLAADIAEARDHNRAFRCDGASNLTEAFDAVGTTGGHQDHSG